MREKYESLSLVALKELAKARGMKGISALKKSQLIEAMLAMDEKEKTESQEQSEKKVLEEGQKENNVQESRGQEEEPAGNTDSSQESTERQERESSAAQTPERRIYTPNRQRRENGYVFQHREPGSSYGGRRDSSYVSEQRENYHGGDRTENSSQDRRENYSQDRRENYSQDRRENYSQDRRENYRNSENHESPQAPEKLEGFGEGRQEKPPTELSQLDSGIVASGILEVMPDGYGFIRSDNYLPGENDVYVSPSQIRKFNLKTGDIISGNTRIKSQQEKFSALLFLKSINGRYPSEAMRRYNFEDMTPVFPDERMRMERGSRAIAMRIVDLFSPIGKGQRGMIVSPPKAGKTTLLKDVARSILQNDPKMRLLILLIDERPEEVTDIKEAICGENVEVIYSTFDELPEHHKRVSEMVIERAKRLVEHKENVTILLDSITRLARAYNLTVPPSGRTLSGGLDPTALYMPKRFFGAARKMREGGSLTILATALVDTGSKMDDVVYEEFKGTGNMELVLDRKLSEKRVFPAIDIPKSGTRREDLLLDKEEQEAVYIMRRALNGMKSDEAVENILNMFVHTKDNRELVQRVRRQKFI